jgi:dCMP deaminase
MTDLSEETFNKIINHEFWNIRNESSKFANSLEKFKPLMDLKTIETDIIYMRMATIWSERSYCNRSKVGCLIVKGKSIISDGYNGSPHGFPNICEDEKNKTLPYILHAEANAITKLAKSTLSSENSTLYVTMSPCYECSKLIIQSGVKRLVIKDLYRNVDSLPFLLQAGVEITRIGQVNSNMQYD